MRVPRPSWLRKPASRAGATVLTVVVAAGAFAAAVGAGYGVTRPALSDGSAYLAKGHTVVHLNGETGLSDAELAQQLATGTQELQTVRLPDGRVAVVNTATGTVTYLDAATLTPDGAPTTAPGAALEPIATSQDGYLVNRDDNTITPIPPPGQPPAPPVTLPAPIVAAAPSGDAAWVVTGSGEVVQVVNGKVARTVRLGEAPVGITVADGHPVVVTTAGEAYVVDGANPRSIGNLGVSGRNLILGSWKGAGRHAVAVDPATGRVGALDPRTGNQVTVKLAVRKGADLHAPVVLNHFAYVPDYAGPGLWRVDLATGRADPKPLDVPGGKGRFSLEVSGGRVWANAQYDRRVLMVDADGHESYADKGAGPDLTDTEGKDGPTKPTKPTDAPPQGPDEGPQPTDGPPQAGPRVTVPAFPAGTPYRTACARIEELKLRCRPVSGGDRDGLAAGDVVSTDPPAGTQVGEGSRVVVRYVGPLRTPDVTGLSYAAACRALTDRGLRCAAEPDATTPATGPDTLGVVATQDPPAGADVEKGGTVRVTYPSTIALPSFAAQPYAQACDALTKTYRMKCTAVAGGPGGGANVPGTTAAQDPPAGTVAAIGSTVTITYFRGSSPLGNYAGRNVDEACAEVTALGFACAPQEGTTAWGNGTARAVYQQSTAAGTDLPVGSTVTLVFYSANATVPASYVGQDINAACAAVQAAGFACNAVSELHRDTRANVAFAQDQPAGTAQPIGSAVTLHYSPFSTVVYAKYLKNDDNVWVLRPQGSVPAGYGRQEVVLGQGYPEGAAIPDAANIFGFYCTTGGTTCNGLAANHFYTRSTAAYQNWNGPTTAGVFMGSCPAGSNQIFRTWTAGSPRYYDLVIGDPGGSTKEFIGCLW